MLNWPRVPTARSTQKKKKSFVDLFITEDDDECVPRHNISCLLCRIVATDLGATTSDIESPKLLSTGLKRA